MVKAGTPERAASRRHEHHPKDFYFAFGFASLAALLHTYAQLTQFTMADDSEILTSSTIPYLFLLIELGLVVNLFGLWLRKAASMLISIIALSGVFVGYIAWYVYSRQILDRLLSKPFYHVYSGSVVPYPFGLLGATWLNLVVLVMSAILFVWAVKTLRSMSAPKFRPK
jgi:hypothetical protein